MAAYIQPFTFHRSTNSLTQNLLRRKLGNGASKVIDTNTHPCIPLDRICYKRIKRDFKHGVAFKYGYNEDTEVKIWP